MNPKATLWDKVCHEAKSFAVIFLYVWAILGLFALHKDFLLGLSPLSGQLFAVLNAVILGKVILILDFFQAGKRLERLPAIVRIAGKAVMFGLLLLAFHILEEAIRGWFHGKTFSASLAEIDGGRLMEMGTLTVMFIVALVPLFFIREIVADIGPQRLRHILFAPRPSVPKPDA